MDSNSLRRARTAAHFSFRIWLLLLLFGSVASARTNDSELIYSTGFEGPDFPVEEFLAGLDGWQSTLEWNHPRAAFITDEMARSGHQSVAIPAQYINPDYWVYFPWATGWYSRQLNYTITDQRPVVLVEADLQIQTTKTATADPFVWLSVFLIGMAPNYDNVVEPAAIGKLRLSSTGAAEAMTFNTLDEELPIYSQPIKLNRWYRVGMELDYAKKQLTYWVNHRRLGSIGISLDTSVTISSVALVLGAQADTATAMRADYTGRVDNVDIKSFARSPFTGRLPHSANHRPCKISGR